MTTTTTKAILIATMMCGRQMMSSACGIKCEDGGHCLWSIVGGEGNEEDNSKMATTMIRATKTPQGCDNQHACQGREAPADDRRLMRSEVDKRVG